eukprot:3638032-Rhodomonas_salina.1
MLVSERGPFRPHSHTSPALPTRYPARMHAASVSEDARASEGAARLIRTPLHAPLLVFGRVVLAGLVVLLASVVGV